MAHEVHHALHLAHRLAFHGGKAVGGGHLFQIGHGLSSFRSVPAKGPATGSDEPARSNEMFVSILPVRASPFPTNMVSL